MHFLPSTDTIPSYPVQSNRLRSNEACWCGSGKKLKRCHGDHARVRRPAVRPGSVSPMRSVPTAIVRPEYVERGGWPVPSTPQSHEGEALDRLRHACRVAAVVRDTVGRAIRPGVTTDELDALAHDTYVAWGAYPSTLGYKGYTKSICTSVNEVVCHGIPDDRPLMPGDIVNVDVTAYIDGMHGDTSATFGVGLLDEATAALVSTTLDALHHGINALGPDRDLRVVAEAIQPLAFVRGFGVVRDYGGHGIGTVFHSSLHVNHSIERARAVPLEPGMTFTVEPMLTAGTANHHRWPDGWTEVTDDLLPSAQFEHTVVITADGVETLTLGESTAAGSDSDDSA
jgi:methionyl aminopeptidase